MAPILSQGNLATITPSSTNPDITDPKFAPQFRPDSICKQRLRERNAGGEHPFRVSEADYDLFTSYFVPPGPCEGFNVVVHTP
jgi:hypothetical protein